MSTTNGKSVIPKEGTTSYWLSASIICFLGAMFYMYEFVLQVSPSVITTQLMRDLQLNAASLGVMAAFYYYAYTPMQIFAGLLYDRFGPRLLITLAILVCAAGAFFFGLTHTFALAAAGRFLMGVGSAFSFIGALLLISRWFPPHYFATLAGIVQFMSSIGAIAGEEPLAAIIDQYGWRHTITCIALIGVLLAALVWLIVRDEPKGTKNKTHNAAIKTSRQRLKTILKTNQTWIIAAYTFLVWAPITIFAALWGIPFLVAAYGLPVGTASAACSMIWLGVGIGSPLIGWWSDRIQRRCIPLMLCGLLGAIATMLIVYTTLPIDLLFVFLFVFGLASAGQSLAFGVVKDINQPATAGTAIGFNNMACVAGGALFQPLVGLLLKLNWDGVLQNGVPVYASRDYRIALILLPLCYVATVIIARFFLRETHCRTVATSDSESPLLYSAS